MICSSLNLLRFMRPTPCVSDSTHFWSHFRGARHRYWISMWWAGFRKREEHAGYKGKALKGFGIFIAAIAVGFAAGGIAQLDGGWR
jgi:hypothetical protein